MANTQSQKSRNQSSNRSQNARASAASLQESSNHQGSGRSLSSNTERELSRGGDAIEQTIAKIVNSFVRNLEPQLNRVANQVAHRVMSRGHDFADTGVRRMQDQPWYMVGGALALIAVGVGLLFAFESSSDKGIDFFRVQ